MTQGIQVRCMLDRFWVPETHEFDGNWVDGALIDVTTSSAGDDPDKLIPVGIVLLADNTFQCVPMEFIEKTGS